MQIFVLGAAVMGIAGAMLTTLDGQFMPGIYQPLRFTFLIWVMVIVGGPRHAQNMNLKRDSPGLSGIKWDKWDAGGIWGRGRAWYADKIAWSQSAAQTTNPPLPVPLPPEGRRGYVDGAARSPSPPPSAARRESQARGASARRLREMNEWRRGLG